MSISSVEPNSYGSPAQSPSLGPSRRLSARRGSISASDPWGAHAAVNMNPSRSSSSRLTIVRIPQSDSNDASGRHRRHGSNASLSSTSSKGETGRLSFAFTTFSSGGGSGPGGRPSSPTSPRIRPASPSSPHRHNVPLQQHTRLTPEQLVGLAHSSCHPRPATSTSAPGSQPAPAPVSFTPLPDSIYLPFIERPAEVTSLISQLPSSKLFALLSQTFPAHARTSASELPNSATPSVESDPKSWTYAELENWLKKVDRDEADDIVWVRRARECVLSHSELIWERIKGALGVPPELNVDDDELPPHMQRAIALAGAKAAARAARGEDIEGAELDAPVFEPDSPVLQPVEPSAEIVEPDAEPEDIISVEPVLAEPVPPPSTSADQGMSSLQEVREEEEDENAESAVADEALSSSNLEEPEIHGLRFSTSPSAASLGVSIGSAIGSTGTSPSGSVRSFSFVGLAGSGNASPATRTRLHDQEDASYDPARERGPGRPLFPTSFAQLALGPSLGSSAYVAFSVYLMPFLTHIPM